MKNLKDLTRDEIEISEIVKSFPVAGEVFLINSNWSYISNILKRRFGFKIPSISANEYNVEINEILEAIQTGKAITIVAPAPTPAPVPAPVTSSAPVKKINFL